ncbi:DUF3592 domain-containing protein [Streptomyces californicus]|uniref:DUF3592 domain-containing protein n=1 Tax=Streptomyces californicus TaxID=67351 RepID=UPI00296F6553|nr:DUF3592 domain-containing protein [Streptomyces californicus]MDW4912806.1 hypothetical protein [Streptomyces californicus]
MGLNGTVDGGGSGARTGSGAGAVGGRRSRNAGSAGNAESGSGSAGAGGWGGRAGVHETGQHLGPRASLLMSLAFALLLGALSALVMFPAAQHLRSLQDGERARATLHTAGACMTGQCKVTFEADGQTVVADLPVGSGGGKSSVGAVVDVRYQADDPRVVARTQDTGGGGAALLAWLTAGAAVFFLALSGAAAIFLARQRRT